MDAFPEKIRPDPTARAPDIPLLPRVPEGHRRTGEHEAVCRQLFHRERVGEWKGLVVADAFPAEDEAASFLSPMFIAQCGHVDGCRLSAAFEAETLVFVGHAFDCINLLAAYVSDPK